MKAFNARSKDKKIYMSSKKHFENILCKKRMSFWGLQGWSHRYNKDKLNKAKGSKKNMVEYPF